MHLRTLQSWSGGGAALREGLCILCVLCRVALCYLGKLLPGGWWLLSMVFVRQTQRGHTFDGHFIPSSAARGWAPSQVTSQASAAH